MNVLDEILKSMDHDAPVGEVRRGLHWTAVVSRQCGLASSLVENVCHNEEEGEGYRPLSDFTALELARYCLLEDPSKASLGIAAINSLIEPDLASSVEGDGLKLIGGVAAGKNIGVIGHFPFLEELRKVAANLWIIEKQPRPGDVPEEKGKDVLPQCDIVVISSTTLVNHTFAGILEHCRHDSLKMLLGPTTPLTKVLFDHGIDILSGSLVTDKTVILKYISEGANFRAMKRTGGIRFVTLARDRRIMI
jgi:uncharacterized protein